MNKEELYKELLLNPSMQMTVAIEELSELQKELTKVLRFKPNRVTLLEEYVDVMIMLEQIKILFNFSENDIKFMENVKLERLEERLKERKL